MQLSERSPCITKRPCRNRLRAVLELLLTRMDGCTFLKMDQNIFLVWKDIGTDELSLNEVAQWATPIISPRKESINGLFFFKLKSSPSFGEIRA